MTNVKWGIIGLGNIAKKFAQVIKRMEGVELNAVSSRSKDRAVEFGMSFDVPFNKCYGSYEEIVQDENIDVIYVAVPHTFHKEISILCLEYGKAVLCEKPVTMNENEVKEVIKIAEESKLFFMEAMKTRFLPINQKVKQLIKTGIIGDVRLLQADFGFKAPFNPSNRLFDKNLGGGALLDVGIYNVSFSSFIYEDYPLNIYSELFYGQTGVDENVSINLSYANGKLAQLYGAINIQTKREANIIGTEGMISIPRFSNAEYATILRNGKEQKLHFPFAINGFEYQIQEVVKCIKEGKIQSEMMSWKDSIEIMRIMDVVKGNGYKNKN